jgi:hypothetical protein
MEIRNAGMCQEAELIEDATGPAIELAIGDTTGPVTGVLT